MYLGFGAGSSGNYDLGATLTAPVEYIGYSGTGAFSQSGVASKNTVGASGLFLGYDTGSNGTYTLRDGALAAPKEYIGYSGTGTFDQRGGTNTVGASGLYLGYNLGSTGTYTLQDGSLTAPVEYIGFNGSGTFNQAGGSNTVAGNLIDGLGGLRSEGRHADGKRQYHEPRIRPWGHHVARHRWRHPLGGRRRIAASL